MKLLQKNFSKNLTKNSILVIGNFDGVHLGHKSLFLKAKKIAKKNKKKFGALTFNPSPKEFFSNNKKINIINFKEKINFLKKLNLDYLTVLNFNKTLRSLSAENFIKKILKNKINPSLIIVGKEFRFGKNRLGNVKLLKKSFNVLCPSHIKINGKKISSSSIRKLINYGKINFVKKFLGRNWSISGKIVSGRKIGRKIGYKTANINLNNFLEPKKGVYAVKFFINKKKYHGIANYGEAPTFQRKIVILEVHLFKTIKNIYKKEATVEFIKYIRGEKKFKNKNLLMMQISKDIKKAKKILNYAR